VQDRDDLALPIKDKILPTALLLISIYLAQLFNDEVSSFNGTENY